MKMKLFHSTRSPFVRKTVVAAYESGQIADVEIVPGDPHGVDRVLLEANALSKIPALITEDGVALPESDLICLYLDERSGGDVLIPKFGPARWRTFRLQALADGFMEAAVDRRSEALRPEGERSDTTLARLMDRMLRCLDALEAETALLGDPQNLGAVATACACSYADFRYPDLDWRTSRPGLAAFFAEYDARPSMEATRLFE